MTFFLSQPQGRSLAAPFGEPKPGAARLRPYSCEAVKTAASDRAALGVLLPGQIVRELAHVLVNRGVLGFLRERCL